MMEDFDPDEAYQNVYKDALLAVVAVIAVAALAVFVVAQAEGSTSQYEYRVQGKANEFSAEYNQWAQIKRNIASAHGRDPNEVKQWARVMRVMAELDSLVTSDTEDNNSTKLKPSTYSPLSKSISSPPYARDSH